MPNKDIFDKPFDEGTISKLEIFENYLDSWLPTFILSDFKKPIQIFDLFAGAGYDNTSIEGSPIRTLRIIRKHSPKLRNKNKIVNLYLNDFDSSKIESLTKYCNKVILEYGIEDVVRLSITNNTFIDFLRQNRLILDTGCNLIFIDQNGFKEVTEKVFQYLINIELSEFIFFFSSSYLHRFADDAEVQKHHPKFDFYKIKKCNSKEIHNIVCREFEKYIPPNINSYSLIPFSIMKSDKKNIYGLVFISKHIRGADKFLDVVWKKNIINGKANFDIEDEKNKAQGNLFTGNSLTKIEVFQNNLKDCILNKDITNNKGVFIYTLNQGHIPKHAHDIIIEMKKEKLVEYNGKSPLVNYNQIYKKHRIVDFRILKHENL
jgi:three-Cys-motif partner protein